ncbi:MAG TPA: hypothetical protein VL588_02355 [Bdellovibrionota bacterium]|nr:hypothetical protein [Bdellovibrionota bacterium]
MKKAILMSLSLIASLAPAMGVQAQPLEETLVPVDHVFSPRGFDDNDDVQVGVTGILPDLCYKAPRANVRLDGDTAYVTVTALHDVTPGIMCARAVVPFLLPVSLGVLDAGSYKIVANEGTPTAAKGGIAVEEAASSAIDNHIYARVESAEQLLGSRAVVLTGFNPSYCFDFDHIEFVSNGDDTLSILPILKQRQENCPLKLVPFRYQFEIPKTLARSEIMLHVRVMNGHSVNILFDNETPNAARTLMK